MLRYRIHLEQRGYAPATVNLRLAAVRRIAYEAADAGLLSPDLAAGIRRVKGVRRIGVRLGNWLTPEQGRRLLECSPPSTAREMRDHAMVAMLIGCGLRRAELLALRLESIQQREEHWVIADLIGKGRHLRCARLCHLAGGELDQIQFLLGHASIQTTERYLGCKQKLRIAVNDRLGIEPDAA